MTTRSKFLWGLAAGAAVGAAAGVLLTPKTGKETRRVVAAGAEKTWHNLKHKAGWRKGHAHDVQEQYVEKVG